MKFNVALCQISPVIADLEKNLAKHLDFIEKARARGADLALFPELSLTGYLLRDAVHEVALRLDDSKLDPLKEASRDISIAFGMVEESEDYLFYNSAIYLEKGQIVGSHRKVYLLTYGMFEEGRFFAPGNKVRAFDTRIGRMGMLICYDMWHAPMPLILAHDGALVILALSASPTRGVGTEEVADNTRVWELLNRFYAKTQGLYVVFSNLAGFEDGINFWGAPKWWNPGGNTSPGPNTTKKI